VARDPLTPGAVAGQLLVVAALLTWAALEGGDPLVVSVTRQRAGGDVLDSPAWLDHAQHAQRLRPWQPGFWQARSELDAIDEARRPLVAVE
jgi:hypothetical protein